MESKSVGIGTTVSINTSGIITASSFVGSVTGTASNASGATGDFSIADKIVHTGDTNTAIRFPAADTVTVETSGSEALRVDSSGRLLLGTTTEGAELADNFTVADTGDCGISIRSGLLITVQYTLVMQLLVLMNMLVKLNTITILIF